MPLTDTAIKKAKSADKPAKLSDGKGMYLLVNPAGSKLWRWKYRFSGKEKVMPPGAYPDVSLVERWYPAVLKGWLGARALSP